MTKLFLEGDSVTYNLVGLEGETSFSVQLMDTGFGGFTINTLGFAGTTSVTIQAAGRGIGYDAINQLVEVPNDLTTVIIKGLEPFFLGFSSANSNAGDGVVTDIEAMATSPTKIHSSLTLIDASATTGGVTISAGATNTSGAGDFDNRAILNANITITYTGLTIKGGSGNDSIENDAKNGTVTDGNGADSVVLGGAGAKATLGTGSDDMVVVGFSNLGTTEAAGNALGDNVTFGAAATSALIVSTGAEAGSTASTASIGLTKVHGAAGDMLINFIGVTTSSNIVDETTAVATAKNLTAAENGAVDAMAAPGVAYFNYKGNEYLVATNNTEAAVSTNDAVVELVGVVHLTATNSSGFVTLHA